MERGGLKVRKLVGVKDLKVILECSLVTWNVMKICECDYIPVSPLICFFNVDFLFAASTQTPRHHIMAFLRDFTCLANPHK